MTITSATTPDEQYQVPVVAGRGDALHPLLWQIHRLTGHCQQRHCVGFFLSTIDWFSLVLNTIGRLPWCLLVAHDLLRIRRQLPNPEKHPIFYRKHHKHATGL
jgi:hypothetical protein